MTPATAPKENIQIVLEELERALEEARLARARIQRTLRDNRREMKQIRADLRRAGLLRD